MRMRESRSANLYSRLCTWTHYIFFLLSILIIYTHIKCVCLFSFNLWDNYDTIWYSHSIYETIIFYLISLFISINFLKLRARIVQIQWTASASKSTPFGLKEVRANLWWLKRPKMRLMKELENFATNPNMRMRSPLLIRPCAIFRLSECMDKEKTWHKDTPISNVNSSFINTITFSNQKPIILFIQTEVH